MSGFPFGRGSQIWRDYKDEPDHEMTNRLLAVLIDTLDDIRNELNEMNARGHGES